MLLAWSQGDQQAFEYLTDKSRFKEDVVDKFSYLLKTDNEGSPIHKEQIIINPNTGKAVLKLKNINNSIEIYDIDNPNNEERRLVIPTNNVSIQGARMEVPSEISYALGFVNVNGYGLFPTPARGQIICKFE